MKWLVGVFVVVAWTAFAEAGNVPVPDPLFASATVASAMPEAMECETYRTDIQNKVNLRNAIEDSIPADYDTWQHAQDMLDYVTNQPWYMGQELDIENWTMTVAMCEQGVRAKIANIAELDAEIEALWALYTAAECDPWEPEQ